MVTKSKGINRPRVFWNDELDAKLRSLYPDHTAEEVAEIMGLRVPQIYNRAHQLNIGKSESFKARWLKLPHGAGEPYQFKAGHETWNKGMKGLRLSPGTEFKPGNRPQSWKPIGSERVDKDGFCWVKVSDDGSRKNRWKMAHVILWESVNGPIPQGEFLVFVNKNKADIRIENLELVTRQVNMQRNSVHNYPKDIVQVVQIKAALSRRITMTEGRKAMSNSSMKDITALRATLFDTIDGIKNKSISLDQAKVINDLSQTIINLAKVEVEHLRTVKATHGSGFIPALVDKTAPSQEGSDEPEVTEFGTFETTNGTVTRQPGRTVHRLK